MTDDTIPKKEFDAVKATLSALEAAHADLDTKHAELKTTHADTLATLRSAEAERDAASGKLAGAQGSVVDTLMAPLVERLNHHPASVQALVPQPTFDDATGKVSAAWRPEVDAWFEQHKSLLKPEVDPADPPPAPGPEDPPGQRPSTPPSKDGKPGRTKEYWLDIMKNNKEQFRRQSAKYFADKRVGGW